MVADADGSDIRPLTGALANFQGSTWARTVAVQRWIPSRGRSGRQRDAEIQILTVDRASDPVVINLHGAAYYLSFRPGDQELTFLADKGTSNGLYAVAVDGQGSGRSWSRRARRREPVAGRHQARLQSISASATPYAVDKEIDVDSGEVTTPPFEPGAISATTIHRGRQTARAAVPAVQQRDVPHGRRPRGGRPSGPDRTDATHNGGCQRCRSRSSRRTGRRSSPTTTAMDRRGCSTPPA